MINKMEDITIYKQFLNTEGIFDYLYKNINWKNQMNLNNSEVKVKINRNMAYISDDTIYKYANFNFQGETWNDVLIDIKNKVEEKIQTEFNSVLLNLYSDGKDEIRWHADKEDSLGENPVIACVNVGATRKFWFLRKLDGEKFYHEVSDGDLLVMGDECQSKYLHAILKESEIKQPRISLTFRKNF